MSPSWPRLRHHIREHWARVSMCSPVPVTNPTYTKSTEWARFKFDNSQGFQCEGLKDEEEEGRNQQNILFKLNKSGKLRAQTMLAPLGSRASTNEMLTSQRIALKQTVRPDARSSNRTREKGLRQPLARISLKICQHT